METLKSCLIQREILRELGSCSWTYCAMHPHLIYKPSLCPDRAWEQVSKCKPRTMVLNLMNAVTL